MPSVYLATVTGDGSSHATAFRPSGFDGVPYVCLMIDPGKSRAVIVSSNDSITGAGITQLVTAASWAALRTLATSTNPSAGQRTAANAWLTNKGYSTLTGAQVTWAQCIHFIARQVNPDADLAIAQVA